MTSKNSKSKTIAQEISYDSINTAVGTNTKIQDKLDCDRQCVCSEVERISHRIH